MQIQTPPSSSNITLPSTYRVSPPFSHYYTARKITGSRTGLFQTFSAINSFRQANM
jgi:hypothetical protein